MCSEAMTEICWPTMARTRGMEEIAMRLETLVPVALDQRGEDRIAVPERPRHPRSRVARILPVRSAACGTYNRIMKAAHLILATVLVLASLVRPASADFLAGWQALADGRYEDARDAWVERAKGGDVDLQYYLGLLHDSGMLGGVDLEAATSWYSAAADRKLPAALHRLAHHALNGTEPDPRLAIELLTRAANLGYVRSLQSLATIYERGVHGAPQPDLASYWYHLAALQGLAEAQYGLARLSALDIGNDNSHEQALVWYRRAAEAGLAEAQNNLAYMFEQGLGVARDFEAAVTWYRRAADQGLAVAQNNLGIMLQYGRGTKVDPTGARMNYEAAARAGHPLGQINFATFLANGIGTEKLLPEAYAWLVVARRSDDENARAMATEFIASLGHRLDHESLRRASIRATGPRPNGRQSGDRGLPSPHARRPWFSPLSRYSVISCCWATSTGRSTTSRDR